MSSVRGGVGVGLRNGVLEAEGLRGEVVALLVYRFCFPDLVSAWLVLFFLWCCFGGQ